MDASKIQRMAEFFRRLRAAPPAGSLSEAFDLLADTLNRVEDELTDIPYRPAEWTKDGRLYPPQADSRRSLAGRADVVRYRTRAHHVWFGQDGAIRIDEVDGQCVLDKVGRNGKWIEP